jgi:hypothetical protein
MVGRQLELRHDIPVTAATGVQRVRAGVDGVAAGAGHVLAGVGRGVPLGQPLRAVTLEAGGLTGAVGVEADDVGGLSRLQVLRRVAVAALAAT